MKTSFYKQLNDKDWLYEQRVTKNRTLIDIAKEVGCDRGSVIRSLKRFGITNVGQIRFPKLYDKVWFENELKTKSLKQIANELGSSVGHIGYRAERLGISLGNSKSEAIRASLKKKWPEGRFGQLASNWQGGRRADRGYVRLYAPDHPHNIQGSVFEHTLIAEKTLGRYIKPDEIVHHINGNKSDNRPENLEVMLRTAHVHEHFTSGDNIQALKKEINRLADVLADNALCFDCGANTHEINEYYMVADTVWQTSKVPQRAMLCIGCLEKRIKRQLTANDFTDAPVNKGIWPMSARFKNRLSTT